MKKKRAFLLLIFIPLAAVSQDQSPIYHDGMLSVPVVDTVNKLGKYQDVTFEYSSTGGWQLTNYEVGAEINVIENVEIIQTETFPVQIFLNIQGTFIDGCGGIGAIEHDLIDSTFEYTIYFRLVPDDVICAQGTVPFDEIIPVPVYGLEAGEYEYTVNSEFSGSFQLSENNSLQ